MGERSVSDWVVMEKGRLPKTAFPSGGRGRSLNHDIRFWRPTLYQLNYTPREAVRTPWNSDSRIISHSGGVGYWLFGVRGRLPPNTKYLTPTPPMPISVRDEPDERGSAGSTSSVPSE